MEQVDVLVVGGGHAGAEAAAAAARRGVNVCLVTQNANRIGAMSCNPSIGGVGKGHLVREVDAFDGVMAVASDAAAIHHRLLNRSKGSAVRGPRIQADRCLYASAVQKVLAEQPCLEVRSTEIVDLFLEHERCAGVVLGDGSRIPARAVVLATGTFLGGRLFRGEERIVGGREGERPAAALGLRLRDLGLPLHRLKTGTPPRLDGRTIDWSRLEPQPSDADNWTMSTVTPKRQLPQLSCAITRTTPKSHDHIRAGLFRSPMFTGAIEGGGPRYCPSIEDKVHRFGDRDGHQIFLEPEGLADPTVYPNGISTSLPREVQQQVIGSIPGLERAVITMFGYAVEYDYLDPRALDHSLALQAVPGVFCAGQLNGTTGYEEAAAQGLVAGLNAAAYARDMAPVELSRASSYIGVMIDDLVLQGVTEPYRMLTARAEYRLSLRADNAEARLARVAQQANCLSDRRRAHLDHRTKQREQLRAGTLAPRDADADLVAEQAEDRIYAPYLARQAEEVARMSTERDVRLPPAVELSRIAGLSNEMVERLSAASPRTLDEARRVRGITPAALAALWLHARKAS